MVLPVFDLTKHFVDTFEIKIESPVTAKSRCNVLAYHFLKGAEKGESWIIVGHYEHSLVYDGEKWLITKMKLIAEEQKGNLMLVLEGNARQASTRA